MVVSTSSGCALHFIFLLGCFLGFVGLCVMLVVVQVYIDVCWPPAGCGVEAF